MKKHFSNLPLGIALGFILSTVIYILGMVIYGVMDSSNEVVLGLLQEQITSIVVLIAAATAYKGISNQIQNSVDASEKVRKAKLDAAKSVLPIVLSNISQLCTERYCSIASGKKEKPENGRWEMTNIELTTLKECIEFSIGVEKELMLQVCRVYQVLVERWDDLKLEDPFSEVSLNQENSEQSQAAVQRLR